MLIVITRVIKVMKIYRLRTHTAAVGWQILTKNFKFEIAAVRLLNQDAYVSYRFLSQKFFCTLILIQKQNSTYRMKEKNYHVVLTAGEEILIKLWHG